MNNYAITEHKYADGIDFGETGAFAENMKITFALYVPRKLGATTVSMFFTPDTANGGEIKTDVIPLSWSRLDGANDVYETEVDTTGKRGLYFYRYSIDCDDGTVWFPDADRQLLVYRENYSTPEPVYGIIYHIFVDRFYKSGRCSVKSGAKLNSDWDNGAPGFADKPGGEIANNDFFCGDLWGVAQKLEYIASLGTRYIYLSPVFDAASNHKYDTGDYLHVDEMFGGDGALENLIAEAGKYGIGVILDGVFNHTGADSVYFNKMNNYTSIGAYQSEKSPYRKWYSFDKDGGYECWWNVKTLPRVNCDEPSYRRFIFGEVIPKWMAAGVSGWRLDVADELSDSFLSELRATVKRIDPNALIIGEVWEDASNKISYGKRREYFYGDSLDSVMNYPLRDAVIAFIRDGDGKKLTMVVREIYNNYPVPAQNVLMNLLSTHDTERIITALAGDGCGNSTNAELSVKRMSEKQLKRGRALVSLAYALICAMPGIPCVFYGDECALEGYRDPFCRMPFPWNTTAKLPENAAMTDTFRFFGELRKNEQLLSDGHFKLLYCDDNFCAVMRYSANDALILSVNRAVTHTQPRKIAAECDFYNLRSKRKISYVTVNPTDYSVCRVIVTETPPDEIDYEII